MGAARRLIEHLSRLVDPLRLARNLGGDTAFQDVSQNKSSMVVYLPHPSRRKRDFADGHLPIVHREVGEVVHENTASPFARLALSTGGSLGEQGQSGA